MPKGSDFIFNRGMVALQYCVSAVQRSESAIGIHISPASWTSLPTPPPPHPSSEWQKCGEAAMEDVNDHSEPVFISLEGNSIVVF